MSGVRPLTLHRLRDVFDLLRTQVLKADLNLALGVVETLAGNMDSSQVNWGSNDRGDDREGDYADYEPDHDDEPDHRDLPLAPASHR